MRPRLIFRLRRREQMNARIRMRSGRVARDEQAVRDLLDPAQIDRARERGADLRRPFRLALDLAPAFVPTEVCECFARGG